jgi:hypothetical protein
VADPVIFDRSSAERIASAVRRVEIGDRTESPLRFDTVPPPQQRRTFRIATFSDAWSVGATKTVTFKYQTATPNTASVLNLFFPYPAPSGSVDCAIAKDGTAWFLIDVPFRTATQAIVSDVQIAASLNTSNCSITVSRTLSTVSVSFLRL